MAGSSELIAAEADYAKEALAKSQPKTPWPLYVVAALCFVTDRILKSVALSGFSLGQGSSISFILFRNTGIAFSIPVPGLIFWPAAVFAVILLLATFIRSIKRDRRVAGILFFIILGAASNLIDRATQHATIDYLLLFGRSAVNIADGMIVGGLLTLALQKKR